MKSGLISNEKWNENYFRVFLSYESTYKKETAKLGQELELYGISTFVAHKDIELATEWQDEIEEALFSMDAFVALITKDFNNSVWTNQEIGFSYSYVRTRNIPCICVNLGDNPKGFAAKFQALECSWESAPKEILDFLLRKSDKMLDAFIYGLKDVYNFDIAKEFYNRLINFNLNKEQCDKFISIYNSNHDIYDCYKFNGKGYSERGIIPYLNNWSDKRYKLDRTNKIVECS